MPLPRKRLLGSWLALAWLLAGPLAAQPTYQAGRTTRSPDGYVEYRPGTIPLIISVPHGGRLRPAAIPDRTCPGKTAADILTQELALAIDSAFEQRYGGRPYLVLCHLARQKLDVNRPLPEASCGNPQAAAAWVAYHAFLDSAAAASTRRPGQRGLLLDLHGHGHAVQRIELGYLLRARQLRLPDRLVPALADSTSIRGLVAGQPSGPASLPALLRGPSALGTLLAREGLAAVPSLPDPAPAVGDFYFDGGYTVLRHGSRGGAGPLDAVQAETNYAGVRGPGAGVRHQAGTHLALALAEYLRTYYHWQPPRP